MSKKPNKKSNAPGKSAAAAPPPDAPRLTLITPRLADESALGKLGELSASGAFASVLLDLEALDERALQHLAEIYATAAGAHGLAALAPARIDSRVIGRAGLDGVEVTGLAGLSEALRVHRPDRIVGVGGLTTRDDAMTAGELEPDYLLFGEPSHDGFVRPLEWRVERASWWAELFTLPCSVYVAAPDEIAPLAAAGVDFLTLGAWLWSRDDATAIIEAARAALAGQRQG